MEIDLTKSDPIEMEVEVVEGVVSPSLGDSNNKRPSSGKSTSASLDAGGAGRRGELLGY